MKLRKANQMMGEMSTPPTGGMSRRVGPSSHSVGFTAADQGSFLPFTCVREISRHCKAAGKAGPLQPCVLMSAAHGCPLGQTAEAVTHCSIDLSAASQDVQHVDILRMTSMT